MVVYEKVITAHVNNELPFMATENILMEAVKRAGTDKSFMKTLEFILWLQQNELKKKA